MTTPPHIYKNFHDYSGLQERNGSIFIKSPGSQKYKVLLLQAKDMVFNNEEGTFQFTDAQDNLTFNILEAIRTRYKITNPCLEFTSTVPIVNDEEYTVILTPFIVQYEDDQGDDLKIKIVKVQSQEPEFEENIESDSLKITL
ncbi:MAG: hypothetical protein N2B06_04825 [Clostridium sp.]